MSAYLSAARALKNALVSIVQGVQYDAGSGPEQAFQLVTTDPKAEFDQEPYCFVTRSKTASKIVETASTERTLSYMLILVLSLESGVNADGSIRTQQETYDYMDDLTELVQNALEQADFDATLSTLENVVSTTLMDAKTSTPLPADSKGGAILFNTIEVAIQYIYDL